MSIDYLYSIVDLYLRKENNKRKTNLAIVKLDDDKLQFNFNMNKKDIDVTSFCIPCEKVFEDNHLKKLLKEYKQNQIIIDEKYENDNNVSCYYVLLNNGRRITFRNFSIIEINNIRNVIYDIKFQKDEIRIQVDSKNENDGKYYFVLQPTGFINFKTLSAVVVCFLIVFILSLWVFKNFII